MKKYVCLLFVFLSQSVFANQTINLQLGDGVSNANQNAEDIETALIGTQNVTLIMPRGTYYIGRTIVYSEGNASSNRKIHIRIPAGTTLKAAPSMVNQSMFQITKADKNYSSGELCIYGGSTCGSTSIGGTIDMSEGTARTNSNVGMGHTNLSALSIGNFKNNLVYGLNIIAKRGSTSNLSNRYADTAIAATGERIAVKFNKIVGFSDAGVYVSGRNDGPGNEEKSRILDVQDNHFYNNGVAVVAKRGFKKTLLRWNTFKFNSTDIAAVGVTDKQASATSIPGREIVAYGNFSSNVRHQFALIDNGKPHSNGNNTYRSSHVLRHNRIVNARIDENGTCLPQALGVIRLRNTEFAFIQNNTIDACGTAVRPFSIITKKANYGGAISYNHSRCNTITGNRIDSAYRLANAGVDNSAYLNSSGNNYYTNNIIKLSRSISSFIANNRGLPGDKMKDNRIVFNNESRRFSGDTYGAVVDLWPVGKHYKMTGYDETSTPSSVFPPSCENHYQYGSVRPIY